MLLVNTSAELLQALQVQVNGTRANGAAARQRDTRIAKTCAQWPQYQDRGTHRLHQLVGRLLAGHLAGLDRELVMLGPVAETYVCPEAGQQPRHGLNVAHPWKVGHNYALIGQQSGCYGGQSRIFAPLMVSWPSRARRRK